MKKIVVSLIVLFVTGCADTIDTTSSDSPPPDPLITNYGVCFSRLNLPAPWTPHQEVRDKGTFSWHTSSWDFGFIAPITRFGYELEHNQDPAQNAVLVRLIENSTAEAPPRSARALVYDRNYVLSDEPSPLPGFYYFEPADRQSWLRVLMVSLDDRIAAECSAPETTPPNPTCDVIILGPQPGVRTSVHMPRRALPSLDQIAQDADELIRVLEVPCPEGSQPTFRYESGRMYLPGAPQTEAP